MRIGNRNERGIGYVALRVGYVRTSIRFVSELVDCIRFQTSQEEKAEQTKKHEKVGGGEIKPYSKRRLEERWPVTPLAHSLVSQQQNIS